MGFLCLVLRLGGQHGGGSQLIKASIIAAKLAVTGACFWYLARNVDFGEFLGAARTLNASWTALAVLVLMLELPLIAVRWCWIVDLLGQNQERISRAPMIAITLIANFFAQVMPNIAADTIRAWMLRQHGHSWGRGLASVMIDRGVGIACLLAVGFVVLLFPSSQAALGGQRAVALEFFGLLLAIGARLPDLCAAIRGPPAALTLHGVGRTPRAQYASGSARASRRHDYLEPWVSPCI